MVGVRRIRRIGMATAAAGAGLAMSAVPHASAAGGGHLFYGCFVAAHPEFNQDVCRSTTDGHHVKDLTKNPASEAFPTATKDGSTVVWSRDQDVWIMAGSGQHARKLVSTSSYIPTPGIAYDGSLVAYVGKPGQVWSVKPNGKHAQLVIKADDALEPRVSADDKKIYFVGSDHYLDSGANILGLNNIYSVKVGGGGKKRVTKLDARWDYSAPALSPDGQHIAYQGDYYPPPKGSDQESFEIDRSVIFVDGKPITPNKPNNYATAPAFSPDSKHLVWITATKADHINGKVTTGKINGNGVTKLSITSSHVAWSK